jgi:hypothetical protein
MSTAKKSKNPYDIEDDDDFDQKVTTGINCKLI